MNMKNKYDWYILIITISVIVFVGFLGSSIPDLNLIKWKKNVKTMSKRYYRCKKLGLCTSCTKKTVNGTVSCRYHLNLKSKYAKKRNKMFRTKRQIWKKNC